MADASIYPLLTADDPSATAMAQALAAALRRQQGMGMILQGSGDKVLAPMGQGLQADALHQQDSTLRAFQARPEYQQEAAKNAAVNSDAYGGAMRDLGYSFGAPQGSLDQVPNAGLPTVLAPYEKKYGQELTARMFGLKQNLIGWKDITLPSGNKAFLNTHTNEVRAMGPDGSMGRQLTPPRVVPGVGPMAPGASQTLIPHPQAIEGDVPPPVPAVVPPRPGDLLRAKKTASASPASDPQIGPLEPWDKRFQPLMDKFKKDMDAAAASSRSSFGESSRVVFRGARNLALLDQKNPDGTQRQLTGQEWQEVAGGLVAMQTGGVPTQEMMREALPKDVQGDAAHIMSWLKSAPVAPDRQAWIERFRQNINREEATALKFQRDTQLQRLPSHTDLFTMFPNRAKAAAKGYGIDPGLIDQVRKGTYAIPRDGGGGVPAGGPPALSDADAQAKAWADANPGDPRAAKIREMLKAKGL